jgi:alpha 1,6-mannosyltransferase
MISYKTIHQTDKSKQELNAETRSWVEMNEKDGWRLNFLDDQDAWDWVQRVFPGSDIEWAWKYMHRGVLRADFLRYLLPLIEGGVYSDVDVSRARAANDSSPVADARPGPSGPSSSGDNWTWKYST